jgi:catechol 2,3-dioxygenase-like lactoylglutathione lyase family enzyme
VPQISGLHHVSLPATDVLRSSDWFERVFGFSCVLIREEEDRVTMVTLEHPAGIVLYLHQAPDLVAAWRLSRAGWAVLGLSVPDRPALAHWETRLAELRVEHSEPRPVHLGLALDVVGPDGLGIQLHTREEVTGEGP